MFRTYEPARDRLVAAKVFRLDITPEQAQALADELARAAEAGLFHPSIVEPIAAGVQGTVAYRAEEYVPAESLDVAMRHYAPATPDKVLPLITQLAGAIDFARAAGIGHGALHPRDVFVTPDEARVTGFGVVEALERVGLRAPVRRPYSPPERIAGEPWGTPADVFSLAAIAFEMLTGRRPSGIGNQIGDIKEPSAGPHAELLRDVLWQGMHEQPKSRFPTALAFAAALEAAARGEREVAAPAVVPVVTAAPEPVKRDEVKAHASESTAAQTMPPPETPDVGGVRSRFSDASAPERPTVGKARSDPTTSASETPAPAAPEPVAAQVDADDDIAAELEEDVAHWKLSREEQQQDQARSVTAAEREDAAPLYADEQIEAAGDRLRLDAADLALRDAGAEQSFASEFESAPEPERPPVVQARLRELDSPDDLEPVLRSGPRDDGFNPVIVPPARASVSVPPAGASLSDTFDRPLSLEQSGESRVVVQRPRTAMLPLAVTLILGLLIGFAAGDYVGSRRATAGVKPGAGGESGGTADPASAQNTGAAPAGKDWTEGSVAQTPGTQTSTPPAAAPDVPVDAPAERATAGDAASAQPPAPTRDRPTTGRLVVRSTPPNAGVTVNGRWRGRTPLTLNDLAFGNYVVRVIADGYRTGREELTLSSSNPAPTVSMRLERQTTATTTPASDATAYFGSVYVDSRPQGATVYIGGKQYGKTPIKIPEVPIGSHVVRLELVDHRSWTTSVRVAAGQEVRATGSLEPIR